MCIYFKKRTKQKKVYFFCTKNKKETSFEKCKNCKEKEYKKYKSIKKKTKKLRKLENDRYSILADDLEHCYICSMNKRDDLHEVFEGANRKTSMKYGTVIPICRKCHWQWDLDNELKKQIQKEAKQRFNETYSSDKFLEVFGKNYI